jgi:hypothetical protein
MNGELAFSRAKMPGVDHEDKNNTVRIGVYTSELIDKLYYDY